jgi:hypothetical protein
VLPGGRTALFTVWRHDLGDATIESLDLATGKRKLLLRGGSFPRYSPTGHLIFVRAEGLAAVPFDLGRLAVLGPPVAVLSGVRVDGQGGAQLALSGNGTLVYVPGGLDERQVHVVLGWSGELAGLAPLTRE